MTYGIDENAALTAATERISELIRSADLATPVDHLSRWKVRDVAAHLGGIHRWATVIVAERSMDGPGPTKSKLDGQELCDWFDQGAEELLTTLKNNEPDAPCPNFNPGSAKTVRWWSRRQANESTVHRWDIEQALGATTPIEAAIAADGVDEFLDVFIRTRGKQTLTGSLRLSTESPERTWTLTLAEKPGRVDVHVGEAPQASAKLSGQADQLLLVLWGRVSLSKTDLSIEGDDTVARSLKPEDN